jgi:hypothetical protein
MFSLVVYRRDPSGNFAFCEAFQNSVWHCEKVFEKTSVYWDLNGKKRYRMDLVDQDDHVVTSKLLFPTTNPQLELAGQFY